MFQRLLSTALAAPLLLGGAPASIDPPDAPAITILGATDGERATILAAAERFAAVDLRLPAVEVRVVRECHDGQGRYEPDTDRIEICLVSEHLVLHEMGHAWEHHEVSDGIRGRFVELSGSPSWHASSTPWHRRGIEQAADVIADELGGQPLRASDSRPGGSLELFHLLTGRSSPRLTACTTAESVASVLEADDAAALAAMSEARRAASGSAV